MKWRNALADHLTNAGRLIHTVRHLKPVQIYGRALRRVPRATPRVAAVPTLRPWRGQWMAPVERPISLIGPQRVMLLNQEGEIAGPESWNDPRRDKLWLYNLHYFDDLNAGDKTKRRDWQRALIERWIGDNPPGRGVGWEPYPTSLRIANWIKWGLGGAHLEWRWLDSLALQARWLARRVEWHLLGNHILANAKALILAGLFFDGREAMHWLDLGCDIYERELPDQILADGGHCERSPMYHAILVEDLLDVINAARAQGMGKRRILSELPGLAERTLGWLGDMVHRDGEIAFFNDAALGIAASPAALEAYAARLGLAPVKPPGEGLVHLADSGYVRVDVGDARAILDLAPIGPDHLPGHAHADTLSFELSVGDERVIVNGGTSRYGDGEQRQRERATAAHSTVEIDDENSSEVWAAFRVARRARVRDIVVSRDGQPVTVSAGHDGYRRLPGRPVHARAWRFEDRRLSVTDMITGKFREAVVRFHLGAGVTATSDADGMSGSLATPGGRTLTWRTSAPATLAASEWHPEFGMTVRTQCLVIRLPGRELETAFDW